MMDITGRTFGRLQVVGNDPARHGYVICQCSCGNRTSVLKYSLTKTATPTRSCGCLHREIMSGIGSRTVRANSAARIALSKRYNTNFCMIEKKEPHKNNRTGRTGVYFNAARGRYEAYITLHNRKIHLGVFDSLEKAVQAREEAEEKFFAPLIAAKQAEVSALAAV